MELELSPLFNEVQQIITKGVLPVNFYYEAEVHCGTATELAMKVLTLNIHRDYEKNIGDETLLSLIVPLGYYAKVLYPNREDFEITLYQKPLQEIGDSSKTNGVIFSERYKGVLVTQGLPDVEANNIARFTRDELDLVNIVEIHIQLLNRSLEKLRLVTVGGVFRNTNTEKVIRAVLSKESNKVSVEGKPAIDSVDIIEASNQEERNHIVIPQGLRLIRVPTYLQERCGGVYNTGIGVYLQLRSWYVYPLFDTTKLKDSEKDLTLIKIPSNKFPAIERTYRTEGSSVFIMGTSRSKFFDDNSSNFMNEGNGVMFADANKFMGKLGITQNNKITIQRNKLNNEFIMRKTADGINATFQSKDDINSNPFLEYSKLAARQGGIFLFEWENANPGLLFPGMRVRILYDSNNNITERHGVLLSVEVFVQLSNKGVLTKRHNTNCILHVFTDKIINEKK
jgi:hypothetical protein